MLPTSTPTSSPTNLREDRSQFFDELIAGAHAHPATNHPWLNKVATGGCADLYSVIRDYAVEYSGYSAAFPSYLRCVIDKLEDPAHKALLTRNLEEEQGKMDPEDREALARIGLDPASVDGVPHPQLFRRFCYALGISEAELSRPTAAAERWRDALLEFLRNASPAAAVGALGLGTEHVVKPIYNRILSGLRRLELRREDYVFFELHCTVDDQHAIDLHNVSIELMSEKGGHQELRRGMHEALRLRFEFWNHLDSKVAARPQAVSA